MYIFIIYQVSKLIHSRILLVKRGSRESHEIQLLTCEVCEGIKSINARVLMPGGDKTGGASMCNVKMQRFSL